MNQKFNTSPNGVEPLFSEMQLTMLRNRGIHVTATGEEIDDHHLTTLAFREALKDTDVKEVTPRGQRTYRKWAIYHKIDKLFDSKAALQISTPTKAHPEGETIPALTVAIVQEALSVPRTSAQQALNSLSFQGTLVREKSIISTKGGNQLGFLYFRNNDKHNSLEDRQWLEQLSNDDFVMNQGEDLTEVEECTLDEMLTEYATDIGETEYKAMLTDNTTLQRFYELQAQGEIDLPPSWNIDSYLEAIKLRVF